MLGRTLAKRLGQLSVVSSLGLAQWLALGCSPGEYFLGTDNLPVSLGPGDSAHVSLVANRTAIEQARGGFTFYVWGSGNRPLSCDADSDGDGVSDWVEQTDSECPTGRLSVVFDDPSLGGLSTYREFSEADLARICPAAGECLVGVTLYQEEGVGEYMLRFGLESSDPFSPEAVAAAEVD